jgi:ATP-dependent RNA helicase HrpB
VRREWLEMFPSALHAEREVVFDAERERVVERRRERFLDLVLSETAGLDVDPLRAGAVLADAARRDPARAMQFTEAAQHWLRRLQFAQRWMPELGLPADTDGWLAGCVADWCAGRRSFAELRAGDVLGALRGALTPVQRRALDREAPDSYQLPSGRSTPVIYADGKPPGVAARIQEVFGLRSTPRLAAGRVALVFHLLAPNQRPVQITDDLESFWRSTYPEVRKLLRGRYPKHPWPEDPLTAPPTARAGRRR